MVLGPESQEDRDTLAEKNLVLVEEAPINTGEHLPQSTPPLVFTDDPPRELRRHAIFQLYLRGYPREAIMRKLGIGFECIKKELKAIKKSIVLYMGENPEVFGSPLEVLYLQVLRRRERQSALWEEIEKGGSAQIPQYYRLLADEDTSIESLLGLTKENLSIIIGSPMEAAEADLFRQLGPEGLKDLMLELRRTYSAVTEGEDIRIIDQAPRESVKVY